MKLASSQLLHQHRRIGQHNRPAMPGMPRRKQRAPILINPTSHPAPFRPYRAVKHRQSSLSHQWLGLHNETGKPPWQHSRRSLPTSHCSQRWLRHCPDSHHHLPPEMILSGILQQAQPSLYQLFQQQSSPCTGMARIRHQTRHKSARAHMCLELRKALQIMLVHFLILLRKLLRLCLCNMGVRHRLMALHLQRQLSRMPWHRLFSNSNQCNTGASQIVC